MRKLKLACAIHATSSEPLSDCTLIDSVFFASTRVVLSITAFMEESVRVNLRRLMKFLISRKGWAYLFKAGTLNLPYFNGHIF